MVILQRLFILLLGIGSMDGKNKERRVCENDTSAWHIPLKNKVPLSIFSPNNNNNKPFYNAYA